MFLATTANATWCLKPSLPFSVEKRAFASTTIDTVTWSSVFCYMTW